MRSRELISIAVERGEDRLCSLLDVVDSWAHQVLQLYLQAAVPQLAPGVARTVDDYVGALHTRDAIHQAFTRAGVIDGLTVGPLAVTDELFRIFTVPDSEGLLPYVQWNNDLPRDPWWWQRIPGRGALASELREVATAVKAAVAADTGLG